jgi:prophage antirepressor-like protein
MNGVQVFKFEYLTVRVVVVGNNPYWCGFDVCNVLGYINDSKAIKDHCNPKGLIKQETQTAGGTQKLTYISEGNLFRLIVNCKLPEAEPFESWVFDEILPQIRKTGSFLSVEDQKLLQQVKSGQLLLIDPKQQQRKTDINLSVRKHYNLPDAAALMDIKESDFYDALDKINVLYVERRNGAPWVGLSAKSLDLKLGTHISDKGRLTPVFTRKGMLHIIRELGI